MKSPIQIVRLETDMSTGRSRFILNKSSLKMILNDHKHRKIVVLSAAGAYRQGKSFLLNIFLRYLRLASTGSTPVNGWLKRGGPLQGFESRNGTDGCTKGIWAYPDLFLFTLNDSSEVAVMLVDCQGAFDNHFIPEECAMVFAFCLLMSSVQIYNVNGRIQRDNLENLLPFIAYGKLAAEDQGEENSSQAFQTLVFTVRDFVNPDEFAYGQEGGMEYLLKELNSHGQTSQLKDIKDIVLETFENVKCYLMPHPGQSVAMGRSDYMSKMEDEFAEHAERLTESLLHPDVLLPKRVAGKEITGLNLIDLLVSYAKVSENGNCIDANTILHIKANFSNNELQKELFTEYTDLMSKKSNLWANVQSKHEAIKAAVFNKFDLAKKLGGNVMATKHRDELEENIEKTFAEIRKFLDMKRDLLATEQHSELIRTYKSVQEAPERRYQEQVQDMRDSHREPVPVKNMTKLDPESDEENIIDDSENEEESSAVDPESEENNEQTSKKTNVSNQDAWFSLEIKKFILQPICDTDAAYAEFCPGSCSTRDKIKLKNKKFKKLTLDAMKKFSAQMSTEEYNNLDDPEQKEMILKTNIKKIETYFKHLKRIANNHSSHVEKPHFRRQSRIEKIFQDDPKFRRMIDDLYLCMNQQKGKGDGLQQNNSVLLSQQHNKIETAGTSAACHAGTGSLIDPLKVLYPAHKFGAPSTSGINTHLSNNTIFVLNLIAQLVDEVYCLSCKEIGGTIIVYHLLEKITDWTKEMFIMSSKSYNQPYETGVFKKIFTSRGPEHDGAAIFYLSNGLIDSVSAKLSMMKHDCKNKCANRGTRHSSACSVSHFTTVPIIVISEEKGQVSLFRKGGAHYGIGKEDLKKELLQAYVTQEYYGTDEHCEAGYGPHEDYDER